MSSSTPTRASGSPWAMVSADGQGADNLPHLRPAPDVCSPDGPFIAFTIGGSQHRPDLGYAADGRAASPADRERLAELAGLAGQQLVFMEQVHAGRASWVDSADAGAGLSERSGAIAGADALVTDDQQVALVALSADCPLVALWEEQGHGRDNDAAHRKPLVAVAHAGWRGLAAGVLQATVELMISRGARVNSLRALVGPSIGPCCYQVGADLKGQLLPDGRALPEHFVPLDGGLHLDLEAVLCYQLVSLGLLSENIMLSGHCTHCDSRLHSYRRDGGRAGRQAMLIGNRKGG